MDFSQITRRAFIWSIAKYISWLLPSFTHIHSLSETNTPFFSSPPFCLLIDKNNVDHSDFTFTHLDFILENGKNHHFITSKHTNIQEGEMDIH